MLLLSASPAVPPGPRHAVFFPVIRLMGVAVFSVQAITGDRRDRIIPSSYNP
jgi:hypothetical protein